MPKLEISPNKTYAMPTPVFVETIDDKYLVIARDTANWLLLNNERQLKIYTSLSNGACVGDVLNMFPADSKADIYAVLVELEAKKFEGQTVNHPEDHGMYIYLTNRCNQKCRHCYMYAGDADDNELTTDEVYTLITSFVQYGGQVVTFTGGEATLRSDFAEIVLYAKKSGLKVCVLSNGLLWTPALVSRLRRAVDEVQISIDGYNASSYQSVRGVDTFHIALDTVDLLLSNDVRVMIAITPLLETLLSHEKEYISFAKSLTAKYQGKNFLVKFNTELMEGRNIAPTEVENLQYRQAIKKIKAECTPLSEESEFALDHGNHMLFQNCGYGGICIASNGDVYFCSILSKCAKQANIRTHSFKKIMEFSEYARKLSDVNNLVPCNECVLKYICGGGCRMKYFDSLVKIVAEGKNNVPSITRKTICTKEQKEKIYNLMVNANPLFYQ